MGTSESRICMWKHRRWLSTRQIRICDDSETPKEMGKCAGLDDDEQSNEGGGEGGNSASMAGNEAEDASDGKPGSETLEAIDAPAADEILWTLSTSCEAVENYLRSVHHLTNFLDLTSRQLFKGIEQCFSLECDAVRLHKPLLRRLIRKVQLEVEDANVADAGEAAPEAEAMEVTSDAGDAAPEAGAMEATSNAEAGGGEGVAGARSAACWRPRTARTRALASCRSVASCRASMTHTSM
jgi:hypothetical protein